MSLDAIEVQPSSEHLDEKSPNSQGHELLSLELTDEEREACRVQFAALDTDGSNSIDASELAAVVTALPASVLPADGVITEQELLAFADVDRDSRVSFDEFVHLVLRLKNAPEVSTSASDSAAGAADGPWPKSRFVCCQSPQRYTSWILVLHSLFAYMDTGFIPVVAEVLQEEFGINEVQLGLLGTAYVMGAAFSAYLVPLLTRRIGSTFSWVMAMMAFRALMLVLFGTAQGFGSLALLRFLSGAGASSDGIFVALLVYDLEPEAPLLWSGVVNAVCPLGIGMGYGVAGSLLEAGWSWESLFLVLGFVVLGVTVLLGFGKAAFDAIKERRRAKAPAKALTYREQLKFLYCSPFNLAIGVIGGTSMFFTQALQYWIVVYFTTVGDIDTQSASGGAGGLLVIASILGVLSMCILMQKLHAGVRLILLTDAAVTTLAGVVLIGLVAGTDQATLFSPFFFLAMFLISRMPLLKDVIVKALPPINRQFAIARLSLAQNVFGAVGPLALGGLVASTDDWRLSFGLLGVISFSVSLMAVFVAVKTYKPLEQADKGEKELGFRALFHHSEEASRTWGAILHTLGTVPSMYETRAAQDDLHKPE